MDVLRDVGVERSYDKPVLKSVFKQQSHRFIGALESIILKLYVKRNARRRDKLKKFLERRYFFAFKLFIELCARVERLYLVESIIAHLTLSVGSAVKRGVVNDDKSAVARDVKVHLDVVNVRFKRGAK